MLRGKVCYVSNTAPKLAAALLRLLGVVYVPCLDLREIWSGEGVPLMPMNGGRSQNRSRLRKSVSSGLAAIEV